MTLDDELEQGVAALIFKGAGPGERELRARRLVTATVRACAKFVCPTVASAEAFCIGRKVSEVRLKP